MELHSVSNSSHYFPLSLTSQKTVLQPQFLEGWFACSPRWSDFKIYLFVSLVRGTQSCGTTERSEANITALNSLRLMTPCGTGKWIEDCQWGIQGSYSCGSLSWSKLLFEIKHLASFLIGETTTTENHLRILRVFKTKMFRNITSNWARTVFLLTISPWFFQTIMCLMLCVWITGTPKMFSSICSWVSF